MRVSQRSRRLVWGSTRLPSKAILKNYHPSIGGVASATYFQSQPSSFQPGVPRMGSLTMWPLTTQSSRTLRALQRLRFAQLAPQTGTGWHEKLAPSITNLELRQG